MFSHEVQIQFQFFFWRVGSYIGMLQLLTCSIPTPSASMVPVLASRSLTEFSLVDSLLQAGWSSSFAICLVNVSRPVGGLSTTCPEIYILLNMAYLYNEYNAFHVFNITSIPPFLAARHHVLLAIQEKKGFMVSKRFG